MAKVGMAPSFGSILTEHVLPFLRKRENVLDTEGVVLIHDKAPCMRAKQTQALLKDSDT